MLMASSYMNAKLLAGRKAEEDVSEIVVKAWASKFEQKYQKAKVAFGEDRDFLKIKEIYDKKMQEMGKQISDSINSLFGGLFKAAPVPPPVPNVQYHIAVNGEASGPFTVDALKEMKKQGRFDKDCLVWNSSMKEWKTAGSVPELASVFEGGPVIPPEIPQM